jgi:predicted nuclease of restriction endonuclease-like RecB superfamily
MFNHSIRDLTTVERVDCKSFEEKKLDKHKMETFISKVIDLTQPKLQTIWNVQIREDFKKFGCGIPFNVIKLNHFKQMIYIVGHYSPRYLPSSYEKLKTTLLKKVKNDLIRRFGCCERKLERNWMYRLVMVGLVLTTNHY